MKTYYTTSKWSHDCSGSLFGTHKRGALVVTHTWPNGQHSGYATCIHCDATAKAMEYAREPKKGF